MTRTSQTTGGVCSCTGTYWASLELWGVINQVTVGLSGSQWQLENNRQGGTHSEATGGYQPVLSLSSVSPTKTDQTYKMEWWVKILISSRRLWWWCWWCVRWSSPPSELWLSSVSARVSLESCSCSYDQCRYHHTTEVLQDRSAIRDQQTLASRRWESHHSLHLSAIQYSQPWGARRSPLPGDVPCEVGGQARWCGEYCWSLAGAGYRAVSVPS